MIGADESIFRRPPSSRWGYIAGGLMVVLGATLDPGSPVVTLGLSGAVIGLGTWLGRREDRLRNESITDPLTGLSNRRHFDACLRRELAVGARHGHPVALLMIDLDALKEINDHKGHGTGDGALRAVADAVRDCCRASDLAARWGGDELIVLAPHTAERDASVLAGRISDRTIERSTARGVSASVTVSIGVAVSRGNTSAATLLAQADTAMCQAKTRARAVRRDSR